jgi:hypothetical protein
MGNSISPDDEGLVASQNANAAKMNRVICCAVPRLQGLGGAKKPT